MQTATVSRGERFLVAAIAVLAVILLVRGAIFLRASYRPSPAGSLPASPSSDASSSFPIGSGDPAPIAGTPGAEPAGEPSEPSEPPSSVGPEQVSSALELEVSPRVPPSWAKLLSPEDLEEVEPEFLPTEEGLYALTLGQYLDPGFLEITHAEAVALLPLDDDIPDWPKDVRSLVGGELPTREDVARAFTDPGVRERLADVLALDIISADLWLIPTEERGPVTRKLLEDLRAQREAAMSELLENLEESTDYPYWRVLQRLREAWAR